MKKDSQSLDSHALGGVAGDWGPKVRNSSVGIQIADLVLSKHCYTTRSEAFWC